MPRDTHLQSCIDDCTHCHALCTETIQYCLEKSGKYAESDHVRLLQDCAEICLTATDFMLRGSDLRPYTCGVCAQVCDLCASSCEQLGGSEDVQMKECAETCRQCARSCGENVRTRTQSSVGWGQGNHGGDAGLHFCGGETTMQLGNALTSIPWGTLMKKFTFLLLTTTVIAQRQASRKSKSDAEKIASALIFSRTFESMLYRRWTYLTLAEMRCGSWRLWGRAETTLMNPINREKSFHSGRVSVPFQTMPNRSEQSIPTFSLSLDFP